MEALITTHILIADRTYRLKIEASEEAMVRKTAALINDKISEFKANFAGKDMQDYVSMALLWFATEQSQAGSQMKQAAEWSQQLTDLEETIHKALAENQ